MNPDNWPWWLIAILLIVALVVAVYLLYTLVGKLT